MSVEELYLPGYNVKQSVESQPTFRRNMPPPSAAFAFKLVSSSADSSALKMEATYSSETSVEFRRTTGYVERN
jgi:hypothetical protein